MIFLNNCNYLRIELYKNAQEIKPIPNMIILCSKVLPYVIHYKRKADFYNKTIKNILTKEILMTLPKFSKQKQVERRIVTLINTYKGLAYEEISNFLYNKRIVNFSRNTMFHLETSVIMHAIYDAEQLRRYFKQLINYTVKQHGMKNYLKLELKEGLIGTYQKKKQNIMP